MTSIQANMDKPLSFRWFISWGSILLGSAILALSFVLFITPYKIIPGGVFGIGIILNSFFPHIQVGTFGLCLDVPLLITAFFTLGSGVGSKTIFSAIITPLLMNLFTSLIGSTPETIFGGTMNLSNDILLSSLFGGATMGIGLGLIFLNHGTSGGTDIISMIVTKYTKMQLSKAIIIVESCVILSGLIIFGDWKLPLYSVVTIFTLTRVIDYMLEGVSTDKLLFIISDKYDEVKTFIFEDLQRGGTYIKAEGMYTKEEKNIIFIVINRKQLPIFQSELKRIDPRAFLVVVEAHETLGEGFKPLIEDKK